DGVLRGIGGVDDRQLGLARVFRVVSRDADFKAHRALDLIALGEELPQEQKDQAGVNDEYADFAAAKAKSSDVGGQKVDRQNQANQPAARKNWNLPMSSLWRPIDKEAAEELGLHGIKAEIDLRQGAGKDQEKCQRQEDEGQAQRAKKLDKAVHLSWVTIPPGQAPGLAVSCLSHRISCEARFGGGSPAEGRSASGW